jgi:hypothetical protein
MQKNGDKTKRGKQMGENRQNFGCEQLVALGLQITSV